MTPEELTDAGMTLYGSYGWQIRLSRELDVDYSTVKRWLNGSVRIPGPAAAAVRWALRVKDLEAKLARMRRPGPRRSRKE